MAMVSVMMVVRSGSGDVIEVHAGGGGCICYFYGLTVVVGLRI